MAEFTSTEVLDDGSCTITVSGEIDIATVSEFVAAAEACLESGSKSIEIDLAAVDFIDSSGLGALVRIRNQANERGAEVTLANVPAAVNRVLEVTGLVDAFAADG